MHTETSHDPLARPAKGRAGSVGARAGPAGDRAGPAGDKARPAGGPRWRALLEARWRARLQEVTEMALAYHETAAAAGRGASAGDHAQMRLRALLRRTVASRRALADTEEALARLSAGTYGWCESCGGVIPAQRLAVTPETRYCARCAQEPRLRTPGPGRARRPGLVT
ncbi:MAG TPA: TraR/DksA family transcriptional regulator [Streptosporangiaceae bacterium]|nr:TraR/DksA family transcriptional regulator [Streptosporangiaceae bacterium]